MLIDWLKFLAALVLLLVPISIFHGHKVRYRAIRRHWDRHWRQILALGLHLIDFGRAVLGAWLLAESLERAPDANGLMRHAPILTQATLLCLAAILQTFSCREPDAAHAPFTFTAGVVAGFLPVTIATLAILLAVAITMGARKPALYFPMLAVSVGVLGYALSGGALARPAGMVAVFVILPWLLTLLFPRQLVVSYLAKRSSDSTPPGFAQPS